LSVRDGSGLAARAFIEWRWLGATGQLGGRDAEVRNIGNLLAPAKSGMVPED
jgi:hypothetical protein